MTRTAVITVIIAAAVAAANRIIEDEALTALVLDVGVATICVEDGEGEVEKEALIVGDGCSTLGVAVEVGKEDGLSVETGESEDGLEVDWLVSARVNVVIGLIERFEQTMSF